MSTLSLSTYILFRDLHNGSGFIAHFNDNGQSRVVLMTCNHVLPSESVAKNATICFGRLVDPAKCSVKNESYTGENICGADIFNQWFKTDPAHVSLI